MIMLTRLFGAFLLSCLRVAAQTPAASVSVSGKVLDSKKTAVPGASISFKRGGVVARIVESDGNA